MSCFHTSSSLRPRASVRTTTTPPKRKPTTILISCCSTGPADSPSHPSYNPLRQRTPSDHLSPDILRHWIDAPHHPFTSQERFTVVSYNILGDRNASKHRDLYPNVPSVYMKWDRRKKAICQELMGWNPDIICMQEVDKYFDLLNVLEKAGYVGSYKRRTGDTVDGCAMFWKADKFRLLERENIEFKGFALRDNVAQLFVFEEPARDLWWHGSKLENARFCSRRHNVLGVWRHKMACNESVLSVSNLTPYSQMCRAESRRILVGNIHVLYNPSRGDVKLGQIRFLSSRAQILSEKWGNVPLVLAGDFNSTPQSAIYKFLSSSELNIKLYDRRELSGQRSCHPSQVLGYRRETSSPYNLIDRFLKNCWTDEEVKVATGNAECHLVVHPLKLNSSYATVKGSMKARDSNGEPLATSYHSKFLGTVDYLWYSGGLVPTRVLDTLPIDILRRTGGLPCKKLGSDHLALVSEFTFTQGTKEDTTFSAVAA